MNDLIITTNSFTPAKVEFNYQQIADQLEIVLAKYKGLVFTEETAADCKKTITELRKGKKSVEDFRKETKVKLSESIVEFENECKNLSLKFDNAILPLTQQAQLFEDNRKEEKRVKVQEIIDKLIIEYELDEKWKQGLIVLDGHLISSISIKKVTESLTEIAINLKSAQDQEESNKDLINSIVEKANKEYEISLLGDTYISSLEYLGINTIVDRIYKDAEQVVAIRELNKQKELDRIEREKDRELLEQQRLAQTVSRLEEQFKIPKEETLVQVTEIEKVEEYIQDKEIVREYRIKATKEELDQLERFLNGNFADWENITLGF